MSLPFHPSHYANDLGGVGYPHNEKNVVVAAEHVFARSDSDLASDNPGGLTFEEGQSPQLRTLLNADV